MRQRSRGERLDREELERQFRGVWEPAIMQARQDVFGTDEPPFQSPEEAATWIEGKAQEEKAPAIPPKLQQRREQLRKAAQDLAKTLSRYGRRLDGLNEEWHELAYMTTTPLKGEATTGRFRVGYVPVWPSSGLYPLAVAAHEAQPAPVDAEERAWFTALVLCDRAPAFPWPRVAISEHWLAHLDSRGRRLALRRANITLGFYRPTHPEWRKLIERVNCQPTAALAGAALGWDPDRGQPAQLPIASPEPARLRRRRLLFEAVRQRGGAPKHVTRGYRNGGSAFWLEVMKEVNRQLHGSAAKVKYDKVDTARLDYAREARRRG